MLISHDAVCQINLSREPAIRQKLHGPIYSCIANTRIALTNDPVNILDTPMAFIVQKRVENKLPMRCKFEFPGLQVLHEDLHLGSENLHGVGWLGGSSFTTSLYRTMTITIKMNT